MMEINDNLFERRNLLLITFVILSIFFVNFALGATPVSPTSVGVLANETKNTSSSGSNLNSSGGYLVTINLSTITQNPHWKGLVGYLTGRFSLDDVSGSTLYDWSLASVSGEIYATRNSSNIAWSNLTCANTSLLEAENFALNQTNPYDNITATFRNGNNHTALTVGAVSLSANACNYTLNTYVNNVSSSRFTEVALNSRTAIIYAAILENRAIGYDNNTYDFQMIVPDNGASGFSGVIPYYLYVKLN